MTDAELIEEAIEIGLTEIAKQRAILAAWNKAVQMHRINENGVHYWQSVDRFFEAVAVAGLNLVRYHGPGLVARGL